MFYFQPTNPLDCVNVLMIKKTEWLVYSLPKKSSGRVRCGDRMAKELWGGDRWSTNWLELGGWVCLVCVSVSGAGLPAPSWDGEL